VRRLAASAAIVVFVAVVSWLPSPAAADDLTGRCRGALPVHPGETLTWRAQPFGGSGDFSYAWSGDADGTERVDQEVYGSVGPKVATVTISDNVTAQQLTTSCLMHVMPSSFVEPPSVTPVLWLPRGVDPAPIAPRLRRAWRWIHTIFFDQYGKTFRMRSLVTIVSSQTETDICGGDCSDLGLQDTLMDRAESDASAAIGGVIPYTRTFLVSAWGAGGFAGAFSWDLARGGVGDWSLAPVAGRLVPPMPPDVNEGFLNDLGKYAPAVSTLAHELNHLIAWDDPHDYSIFTTPDAYERAVALAGPFLTQGLADAVGPSVSFTTPAADTTISGTTPIRVGASDAHGVEAVQFLVDGYPAALDTGAPFSFGLDTTQIGTGRHRVEALAFDPSGNGTTVGETVFVDNALPVRSCPTGFPTGTFRACFYDGVNSTASFIGAVLDHPFPTPSRNVGFGPNHLWGADAIAFGRTDHVTGVWRGTLDLRPGRYVFRFFTDDGIRVQVDGVTIVDALQFPQVSTYDRVVQVDGPVRVSIRWFENDGSQELQFRWWPTTAAVTP
jgi:hypothetical protein